MSSENDEETGESFENFCKLYKELLFANGLSPHLLRSLHKKLEDEIFDAGDYFLLTPEEEGSSNLKVVVGNEDGVTVTDDYVVFLIDHAWTYKACDARKQLCEIPGLLSRLSQMMGYSVHGEAFYPDDDIVNTLRKEMWKYNQTYSMNTGTTEDKLPVWYIMDEFGTCIRHSDSPTVAVVPFYYQPKRVSYSILWPLTDLDYGDEVSRDFAYHEKDPVIRKCRLLPWIPADLSDIPSKTSLFLDKHYESRFDYSGETLPESCESNKILKKRVKIYMGTASEFLTDVSTFEVVDDVEEADILFACEQIKDFKKLSKEKPNLILCQFPCEMIMFCKDFFMDIAKRSTEDGRTPPWYPVTFDMYSQFPQFISHFQKRSAVTRDRNVWICKPWNLARSLDTTVSNDLNEIIRLRETEVPKIVSKYIEHPVLHFSPEVEGNVKYDMSYWHLPCSHSNFTFVTYFTLFTLDRLDNIEEHFTALRDEKDGSLISRIVSGTEFVRMFEEQYPNNSWKDMTHDIYTCISKFFKSATSRLPPYGVGHYSHSRALYGFDIMLEWDVDEHTGDRFIQPILLECNFMPNLTSICSFYPSFLSDAFRFLFLGDENCQVTDISDM